MTIQEMARIYKRICKVYHAGYCEGCPMLPPVSSNAEGCLDALIQFPDECEKVLLDWVKENPAPTNRDKFFEVFGDITYKDEKCKDPCELMPCYHCDWWNKEYVEPEKGNRSC